MAIEHVNLVGDQLHESKGISAASDKQYNLATSGANSWSSLIGVQTYTASSDTGVFTNLSEYNILIITLQDIRPFVSAIPVFRVSSDNGSTYASTDIYYEGFNEDGTGAMSTDFSATYLNTTNTIDYHTGKIILSSFNQAAPTGIYGHIASTTGSNFTTAIAGKSIKGFINSATAWNAIQFFPTAGNFTSGKIILEGIKG